MTRAPVRRGRCVQSVGAGLPDRPAVGSYRYNQAQANPSPGTRQSRTPAPTRGGERFGYDEAPVRRTQCVQSVGNGFIRSANRVRHTECMNAFPTRETGRLITAPTGAGDAGG